MEKRILALPVRFGGIAVLVTQYYLPTLSILYQPALTEILRMSYTAKTKILPTMTEYKLIIRSTWSRRKKNRYYRTNTINYLKKLMLD